MTHGIATNRKQNDLSTTLIDSQPNGCQNEDTQHSDTHQNDTEHSDTQHRDTENSDTQHSDTLRVYI
jgi:hypothetical protein